MRPEAAAELAVAGRLAKQAQDACRRASARLAAAQDGGDVYAQRRCTTRQDVDEFAAVLRLAVADHGTVDVVALIAVTDNSKVPVTGRREQA